MGGVADWMMMMHDTTRYLPRMGTSEWRGVAWRDAGADAQDDADRDIYTVSIPT